mgnify:CR=1 FL=1
MKASNLVNLEGTRPFRAVSEQHGSEKSGSLEPESMEGTRPFRAFSEQHGGEKAGNLESMEGAHPFGAVSEQHGREDAENRENQGEMTTAGEMIMKDFRSVRYR